MKTLLLLLVLFAGYSVHAQQQFRWVKGGGSIEDVRTDGSLYDEGTYHMCTDQNGNIYAMNEVGTSLIAADTFHKTSAYGSPTNILVTSYNCNGQMRWAKLISSPDGADGYDIKTDNIGHVYIAGRFTSLHAVGGSTLHIGYDTVFTSTSFLAVGVIQLDTSGNYKWIRFLGNNTALSFASLAGQSNPLVVDVADNAHFLCYMESGVPLMTGVTSHYGVYDMKYDPTGALLSAVRLDLDSQWFLNSAVIDPVTNKLYVSGKINQSIYGGFLTDTFYAAAFDASRNKLWWHFPGRGNNDNAITGVTIDQSRHLHFSGTAQSPTLTATTFSFNGDSVISTRPPKFYKMSVILTTDTNGHPTWIKKFDGSSSINTFNAIATLPNNKVVVVGTLGGVATNGKDSIMTTSGEGQNPFLVITDSAGDIQTIQQIHGNGFYDGATAVTSDKVGNVYVGGYVEDTISAGSPPITSYHSVGGNTDFFVMKYGVDCSCSSMPIASYTSSGTHTLSVTYTGTTTGLDSMVWNFGDGSATVKGTTASHTYAVADTYRVCATVYTTCGNDIYCSDVIILCGGPAVASFTDTGMHTVGVTYTGTTAAVDSIVWNFGDGTPTVKGTTALHTYAAVGVYTICVTAWSVCGNGTACKTVSVTCVSVPAPSFTGSGSPTLSVAYTGTTTAIDSIVWKFGDGGKATGSTAVHSYAAVGTYTVCVTAYSRCGSNTSCKTFTVPCITSPTASFTDTGRITLGTTYTGTTVAIDSVVWDFGDGSGKVKGLTALHSYTAVGIYHVCVTAYNPCGNNTYCGYDTVRCITLPIASLTDTGSHTFGFTYTGTTAGIDSIVWSFGDGATSTGTPAIHAYSATGTFLVCVTVYTPCGKDSACSNVTVHTLAVSGNKKPNIKVFPNPAKDELTITGIGEITQYRLLTVTGIIIDQGALRPGNNAVSMQKIIPGIYMLELTGSDGERITMRVVKQ